MIAMIRLISVAAILVAATVPTAARADNTLQELLRKHGEAFELAGNCPAAVYDREDRLGYELARRNIVLSEEVWSALTAQMQQTADEIAKLSEDKICALARERYGPEGTQSPGLIEFE